MKGICMTILVDMDDTIEQLLAAWVKRCNEKYGYQVTCDDIRDWNVTKAFPGLTREQVYGITYEPGFWGSVEPIPGAADALQRLIAKGHDVYIVTATEYEHLYEKMHDLLFRYFPFLTWKQVIVTSQKQMIRGDILIDDGPHNLIGGDYIKLLYEAPHNRDFDAEVNGIIRVHDWTEAETVVENLEQAEDTSPDSHGCISGQK